MKYRPNPTHKRRFTEAGPGQWRPDKEPCPDEMTVEERSSLLRASVPVAAADPRCRRFAMRRSLGGVEFFEASWTRDVEGEPEFHGHPTRAVPASILREFVRRGELSDVEYCRLVKELG